MWRLSRYRLDMHLAKSLAVYWTKFQLSTHE